MQKLRERNTYTPTDAPQVRGNCGPALNREETLSVPDLKTSFNNPDVDQSQHTGRSLKPLVYVFSREGNPLMPCTSAKAKRMLKKKVAEVVICNPFTIRLSFDCENKTQGITLGIDAGYSRIGFSAISDTKELIAGEVQLRKDVSKKLTERRMYRRGRRNKLWYRQARWQNRVGSKKENWLAPSIQHKLNAHISLVNKIKNLLPISNVIVEVASFDTQKMQNPEISGIEYQQGTLQGYEVREYLLEKFNRICAYCGKKDVPLEIEHIVPRSCGGSNQINNLTISCHKCNEKKGTKTAEEFGHPEVQTRANKTLKETAFMNIVRWKLVDILGCKWTFGYITKHNRIKLGLEKSHSNDAFIIANGVGQQRGMGYPVNQCRRNNRCLQLNRKGFKPSIRRKRYKLQPHALVKYLGKVLAIKGVCNYGRYVLLENKKYISINKVKLLTFGAGMNFGRYAIPLTAKAVSPLA